MDKVSVIAVSGFVGAGKTTLVGRLVQELDPARTAVMTDGFPEIQGIQGTRIGIDLARSSGGARADLSCDRHGERDPCSRRRRLADAIIRAARSGRCETILVENSGGTDPLLIANLFEAHTPPSVRGPPPHAVF